MAVLTRLHAVMHSACRSIFLITVLFVLMFAQKAYSVAVQVLEPADGQYLEGNTMTIHFIADDAPLSSMLALYVFNQEIYRTEKQEDTVQFNVEEIANVNWVRIEARLLYFDEGEIEQMIATDHVSVFLLGDAVVAPPDMDEDDHNSSLFASMFQDALKLKTAKDLRGAHSKLEDLLALANNIPGELVPTIYTELGTILLELEDVDGALLAFRDAVWHTPTSKDAHLHIAAILRMQESTEAYRRARRGDRPA